MCERPARFPKRERMRARCDFRRVFDCGRANRRRHLVLIVHRDDGGVLRVGFVASRKVGNAVRRNRARRLMRESYRRLRADLRAEIGPASYVFVARAPLPDADLDTVMNEMRQLLVSASVIDAGGFTHEPGGSPE